MSMNTETVENISFSCINCGLPVKNLYRKYSSSVLKLTECEACGKIADKYVEYDTAIIMIDLILLKLMAFRHILLNSKFKNFWKLSIILLLLETYSNWSLNKEFANADLNITKPYLLERDIYLDDFEFYKISLYVALSTASFLAVTYSLTKLYTSHRKTEGIDLIKIGKTITLSNASLFLLFPSLIWGISIHEYHIQFISLYTTLSQLLAYRALCNCTKLWSLFVIFSSHVCKIYAVEFLNTYQIF